MIARPVDGLVVEEDEGALQTGDDQVLVVAWIGDDRRVVAGTREILEQTSRLDLQLVRIRQVVELWARDRAAPVHRVQIERGRAGVLRAARVSRDAERRGRVEGDVVVDELADERGAGRVRRIVRIVRAQAEIRYEQDRSLAQIVLRVKRPTLGAQIPERILHCVRRRSEGLQVGEDPPERRRARRDGCAPCCLRARREGRPDASGHRDRADTGSGTLEEPAAAIPRVRTLLFGRAHCCSFPAGSGPTCARPRLRGRPLAATPPCASSSARRSQTRRSRYDARRKKGRGCLPTFASASESASTPTARERLSAACLRARLRRRGAARAASRPASRPRPVSRPVRPYAPAR